MLINNNKTVVYIATLFWSICVFGQGELKNNISIKAGTLQSSIAYEYAISPRILVSNTVGIYYSYHEAWRYHGWLGTSFISITPRYYYNLSRRFRKGKNTANNAGNYFGLEFILVPDVFTFSLNKPRAYRPSAARTFFVLPTYGLRRNIIAGLNFDFDLGIGISFDEYKEKRLAPNIFAGLSYVF